MGDRFIAETQYSDLVGNAAFDGHTGPPLHELAKYTNMPKGKYWPVGFRLFRLHPGKSGDIPFTIIAVNCEEIKARNIEEIVKYAQKVNELPAYKFDGNLEPKYFSAIFKRIDIKIVCKSLKDVNIIAHYPKQ